MNQLANFRQTAFFLDEWIGLLFQKHYNEIYYLLHRFCVGRPVNNWGQFYYLKVFN